MRWEKETENERERAQEKESVGEPREERSEGGRLSVTGPTGIQRSPAGRFRWPVGGGRDLRGLGGLLGSMIVLDYLKQF